MTQLGNFWPNLTATETITDCQHTIHHQIVVTDATGCVSNSNITTGVFSQLGNVVSNPDLRCVSVLPNGNVQITWLTPSGSATDFNNYKIKRNNVIIDSVGTFPQTSFIDAGINANNFKYDYEVVSNSGCSGKNAGSNSTNTLSSIHLVTSTPTASSCQVDWNAMPLLSGAGFYEVNRDIGSGFVLINNTLNLTYLDANIPGPATALYKISVNDISGCISRSNVSNPITITSLFENSGYPKLITTFPNPVTDKINFSKPVQQLIIYDVLGKCVLVDTNEITGLDVSNLKVGRYTAKMIVDDQLVVIPFIKN
ncbi:MAG: T9SS type A sorting domain-containing protein [Bacteroidetes bacterium]|nr:T9SS type A sorting domain-containing protein [Bacteroidota bacterium]